MSPAAAPARRRPDRPGRGITTEQRRTLRIVTGLTLLQGRTPSLGDIADALHIRKPTAHERLYWLEKKGLWCSRSRSVTPPGLTLVLATLPLGEGPTVARAVPR